MSSLSVLPANALPLAEAVRQFVPQQLWLDYERASQEYEESARIARLRLPIAVPNPYLVKAQQDRMDQAWQRILHTFIQRLVSGSLIMYVQSEPPFGAWRALDPQLCRSIRIKDLRNGSVTAPNFELSGVYVAEGQSSVADVASTTTGAPGRPTSMQLIEAEFARRVNAGIIESNLTKESKVLAEGFKAEYPGHPPATAKTIENKLRSAYRAATSNRKPPKL